jgi:hypothetical protein
VRWPGSWPGSSTNKQIARVLRELNEGRDGARISTDKVKHVVTHLLARLHVRDRGAIGRRMRRLVRVLRADRLRERGQSRPGDRGRRPRDDGQGPVAGRR